MLRATPDSPLTMIRAVAVLNALHASDHVLRGDFHWPLDSQSVGFLVVIGTIYTVIGVGLTLSRRGVVAPRFWVTIGTGGLVLGSHISAPSRISLCRPSFVPIAHQRQGCLP
ncbi:MAG: hypothetical protein HY038_07505 [Nitrospirae bacterium]|nr:hypothetical protein [Nitrospirota bacterium]